MSLRQSLVARAHAARGVPPIGASALLLPAWILAASLSLAQDDATLHGRVVDEVGKALPGASITVRSASNPWVDGRGTLSDPRGEYRLAGLPAADDYEVTCKFPGRMAVIQRPVRLSAGGVTVADFYLAPPLVERITLVDHGDIVDTRSTSASTVVDREFLAGLPLLGRNYSDVLALAPGVTDTDGDGNPNVKGAREVDFQLRISGVQVNDPFAGTRALDFNIEAIEQIQILTGAMSAEYSSQGGVGSVTTRSGGNEFEGSFKMFYQTRSLDGDGANNNDITDFQQTPPAFRTVRPFLTAGGAFGRGGSQPQLQPGLLHWQPELLGLPLPGGRAHQAPASQLAVRCFLRLVESRGERRRVPVVPGGRPLAGRSRRRVPRVRPAPRRQVQRHRPFAQGGEPGRHHPLRIGAALLHRAAGLRPGQCRQRHVSHPLSDRPAQ